jgi:hypothetical protein
MAGGEAEATLLMRSADGAIDGADYERLMAANRVDVYLAALAELAPDGAAPESAPCGQVGGICSAILALVDGPAGGAEGGATPGEPGTVELSLKVLLRHTKDARIIESALCALAAQLRATPDAQRRMGELKGPQLIVRSMMNARASKSVQLAGAELLLDLTPSQQNREIMGQFFAVDAVLAGLKSFGDDGAIVTTACAFLANIGFESPKNKALIVEGGGLKVIMRVMRRHKESEAVNVWGALALRNLSLDNAANQAALTEGGCVRLLLAAVLQFKDTERLIDHVLAVVRHLVEGAEECHEESAVQVVELRGVEIIVRCMRTFRGAASLHHSAVACLRALADHHDRHAELVVSLGGAEATLSSMIAYRSMEGLQASGIALLHRLGGLTEAVRARIVQAGGLNTISLSLKTHIGNEAMVESGVTALNALKSPRSA